MDISKLTRDPAKVRKVLTKVPTGDGVALVANGNVKILFPKVWLDSGLGSIDSKITVLSYIGIIADDKHYSMLDVMSKISLNPYDSTVVKIDDVEYYQLSYVEGETIADSIVLVKDGNNAYLTYNEFISKGKIPWYMSYTDVTKIFNTAGLHAGYNTGTDRAVESLFNANRSKDPKNPNRMFRYSLKTQDDLEKIRPVMLPLASISGATSASSRLGGNYMKEGVIESLVKPTLKLEDTDKLVFL